MSTDCGHATDIDLGAKPPVWVGVDDGRSVRLDRTGLVTRVRAADLRSLSHAASVARQQDPERSVLADVEVVVADDARTAREVLTAAGGPAERGVLRYVGTLAGLAGLISDMYVLGLADGVVLIPLVHNTTPDRLLRDVLTELHIFLPPV